MKVNFNKRYEKFKKNNLPTPFWDNERQTLEYVTYDTELDYWNNIFKSKDDKFDRKLKVHSNLEEALSDLAYTGFYYSYTCGYFSLPLKNDKESTTKKNVGHTHSHTFEEVIRNLYDFPESFSISKEEEKFYSQQQLEYIRRVQKYLLFIGLKDVEAYKHSITRYRNNKQKKYGIASIHSYSDKTIEEFLAKKRNFVVIIPDDITIYKKYEEYPNHDRKELIVDKEDNFKLFIEYTHSEIKKYKDIKKEYTNKNLKNEDEIVVEYFKILEIF